jgi:beta-lactamase superfamily II metal-dependent hydrolase
MVSPGRFDLLGESQVGEGGGVRLTPARQVDEQAFPTARVVADKGLHRPRRRRHHGSMPQHPPPTSTRFAGYSDPVVYDAPDGSPVTHLLWGDWLRLKQGRQGEWREVRARGVDGWMREEDIQRDRILEVVFVDIGQGDGCLVVTPEDEHLVIDAGQDDSMFRFLNWRYGGFRTGWTFAAGIMSHPDSDHYKGFHDLFLNPHVAFDVVYTNGIMERRADGIAALGPSVKVDGRRYLTERVRSRAQLEQFLAHAPNWRHPHPTRRQWDKLYPTVLNDGVDGDRFDRFEALSHEDGHVPGWGPGEKSVELRLLAPVLERPDGLSAGGLRVFDGSVARTKNGHSVVIRLVMGDVSILLGGDLNIPSQELLLAHYTGLSPRPTTRDEHDALIEAARRVFQVDIAKACHHGAADISTRFLAATNPVATVISSGDDESHAHPRADALGATGKHGRGNRPLIFSTELGRSAPNRIRHPAVLKQRLVELLELIPAATGSLRTKLQNEFNSIVNQIDRSVAVYGAIQLRTDGTRVVMAQKLERPRGNEARWDVYRLEPQGDTGALRYVSKYDPA